jgi:two-component system response regulator MprA
MDARLRRQCLLLVDDEPRSARLLARLLREDGYDVELLHDGAAAIGRLTRDPLPDVLVTDMRMPHADGDAVARYARSRRADLPIVFLTGYPELLGQTLKGLEPAPVVHTKPIDYHAFREQVRIATGDAAPRSRERQ